MKSPTIRRDVEQAVAVSHPDNQRGEGQTQHETEGKREDVLFEQDVEPELMKVYEHNTGQASDERQAKQRMT